MEGRYSFGIGIKNIQGNALLVPFVCVCLLLHGGLLWFRRQCSNMGSACIRVAIRAFALGHEVKKQALPTLTHRDCGKRSGGVEFVTRLGDACYTKLSCWYVF